MQELDGLAEVPLDMSRANRLRSMAAETSRAARRRREWLAEIVDAEVLPRLLDAHGPARRSGNEPPAARPPDPDGLVALLREGRAAEVCGAVEARLRSGVPPRAVMIEDLGPAARKLGKLWETDECDIVDVTLGLGVLEAILGEIAPFEPERKATKSPSILIALTPGETHGFGANMAESFFRSAGWRTSRCLDADFRVAVRREGFDVIGFSLSCERYLDSLERAVAEARDASRNRRAKILVGGAIFGEKPALAKKIGADLCAANAEAAIHISSILLKDFV